MKTFNLYCDESCHLENDKREYMLLAFVGVPYNQMKIHNEKLKEIKNKHYFFGEIKWSKVSNSQHKFYNEVIDYFFASDLTFRAIVIKKGQINNQAFEQDYDTFYYKMYFHLLNHKIDMLSKYNIYLDIKDRLSAKKVAKLKEILQTKYGVFRNLQNIHSKESIFMQLTDLLMGAVNYHLQGEGRVIAKNNIISRIQKHSSQTLSSSSSYSTQKVNLFFIDLR